MPLPFGSVISTPPPRRFLRHAVLLVLATACMAPAVFACSVPVFRYGLEHWKPDPYRVLAVHRGALSVETQQLVADLKDASSRANLTVHVADLTQSPAPDVLRAWQAAGSPEVASLIVLSPATAHEPGVVWSCPLSRENIAS